MPELPTWVSQILLPLVLLALWCAWWLWCVNWQKAWPVLSEGGWVPLVLLVLVVALAWSSISPSTCRCLGFPIANFLWQLIGVTGLTLLMLFCGWVQGRLGWTPAEVSFEPPPPEHGHGHHGAHH
jgi:hypothetical protein